jgi:CRP/FNR family cyclic AMP-dependent transcriptional regulator
MPESRPPARELLAKVSIFAGLDAPGLGIVERSLKLREFSEEALIVSHEEPGDALFILASGRVKVVLYGESGREMILSTFRQPGEFFGEMSLLDDEPRSANVIAVEDSALYVLDRRSFNRCVQENPAVALAVLAELSRRLRRADEIIGNLALLDVHGRVAHLIRELARNEGQETDEGVVIRQRPSQSELAAMVGTSRETVSRALSEFQRRGLLEMEGRRILVRRSFLDEP